MAEENKGVWVAAPDSVHSSCTSTTTLYHRGTAYHAIPCTCNTVKCDAQDLVSTAIHGATAPDPWLIGAFVWLAVLSVAFMWRRK